MIPASSCTHIPQKRKYPLLANSTYSTEYSKAQSAIQERQDSSDSVSTLVSSESHQKHNRVSYDCPLSLQQQLHNSMKPILLKKEALNLEQAQARIHHLQRLLISAHHSQLEDFSSIKSELIKLLKALSSLDKIFVLNRSRHADPSELWVALKEDLYSLFKELETTIHTVIKENENIKKEIKPQITTFNSELSSFKEKIFKIALEIKKNFKDLRDILTQQQNYIKKVAFKSLYKEPESLMDELESIENNSNKLIEKVASLSISLKKFKQKTDIYLTKLQRYLHIEYYFYIEQPLPNQDQEDSFSRSQDSIDPHYCLETLNPTQHYNPNDADRIHHLLSSRYAKDKNYSLFDAKIFIATLISQASTALFSENILYTSPAKEIFKRLNQLLEDESESTIKASLDLLLNFYEDNLAQTVTHSKMIQTKYQESTGYYQQIENEIKTE